jgi:hypothetical protein
MASRKIEDLTLRMQEKIRIFEERLETAIPGAFKRSCTYRSQQEKTPSGSGAGAPWEW